MTLTDLILVSLATWRLTNMLIGESGPGNIFGKFREAAINPLSAQIDGTFSELLTCPYCLSVWLGAILLALQVFRPTESRLLILPLAVAGLVALLQQLTYDRPDYGSQSVPLPDGPPELFD